MSTNGLVIDTIGNQWWYKNGKLHRNGDLPAIIYTDGSQFWLKNGKYHRDDGPARISGISDGRPDGCLQWFRNNYCYIPQMKKL